MLNAISADTVREIARLADAARQAQDRLFDKMNNLGHRKGDGIGAMPPETDYLDTLDASLDNPALTRLRERVAELTPAARDELRAVMLIGRGEFARNEWDAAIAQAQSLPNGGAVERITDRVRLHDYLMKGLYELRLT